MSEKELVILSQKGNEKAFCELYSIYKGKLYGYAFYRLENTQDAEDVLQNCMLTAFENIGKLKKPEAFYSWVFKILYYGCNAAIKEQIKKRNTYDIEDYQDYLIFDEDSFVEQIELKQALNTLKEQERNIVLLSVIAGLSSKEIATITGLTAVNVRQKLSRSLTKMRNYLEEGVTNEK